MFLDQLLCKKETFDSKGNKTAVFSVDVLIANAMCAALGFLPFYFFWNKSILKQLSVKGF